MNYSITITHIVALVIKISFVTPKNYLSGTLNLLYSPIFVSCKHTPYAKWNFDSIYLISMEFIFNCYGYVNIELMHFCIILMTN